MYYQNYHKHTSLSHRYNKDSSLISQDYFNAMKPLADKGIPQIYSTVEHGWQGNYFHIYDDLEKFNNSCAKENENFKPIKFVFGVEAYWVDNHKDKDASNNHIILLAKNDNGRKALNYAIAKSFVSQEQLDKGTAQKMFPELSDDDVYYYYKNRMDIDLLLSLPSDDVFVTTACVAFWLKYSNGCTDWSHIDEDVLKLNSHFKDFYLEVQANNTDNQKKINAHILELHKKYGIPIISATDSHEITMIQMEDREYLLESNKISYPDEDGNYMDFPSVETLQQRYKEQGILSEDEYNEAIENTNKILDFEDIVLDRSLKVPVIKSLRNKTQEERNKIFKQILIKEWNNHKDDINQDKIDEYKKEIQHDYKEIIDCGMADYFIDDYYIVDRAQKVYGGVLTPTGRGSAVSMFLNYLLNLTKVDKVNAPVTMYSERFLTATRILDSHTPPDIDCNVSSREPFIQAQKDLIGENGTFDFIAIGKLKYKSAFKMYARANKLSPTTQNEITKQIDRYETALKHKSDDESEDDYSIYDYVDEQYKPLIDGCQKYRGIVDNLKAHACASLSYNGNAITDVGVIMVKSESTKKEVWVTLQESSTMDAFGYLKNDWLIVDSIGLTYDIYKEIGMKPMTVNQLLEKIANDDATWDIYKKGYTMCINQVEQKKSTEKVMRFKPKNIYELCQFVAAIRPSFQSMYNIFEARKHFDYGIKTFDNILQDKYCTSSFIIYQEDLMKVLGFAGFPMGETYTIIKAISKKKKYVIDSAKPKFIKNFAQAILNTGETDSQETAHEMATKVWTIIENSASYGFNCVSGSTKLYRDRNDGFQPTIQEMYDIMNDAEYAKKTGHKSLHKKYQREGYGYGYSLDKNGRIYKNKIIDIYKQPSCMTYIITTKSGKTIKATENHKFPIGDQQEIKYVKDLKIGDKIIIIGQYEKDTTKYNLTDGNFESNIPHKGQRGFQLKSNSDVRLYTSFRQDCITTQRCCEDCGKKFSSSERFEVHHKDFNRHNNSIDNYVWLCASCHKKRHYNHGRRKKGEKGYPSYLDEIVSIEPYKIETVYDVSMSSDVSHTFVIDNGIVTSNCSHSYCMAIDSVTLAWLKAHYPYEFYKVTLQRYTNKGDKDKVTALKQEMGKLNVPLKPVKFGDDNRAFNISPNHDYISQTMVSLKGIQKIVPDIMYELGQKHYNNFIDILKDIQKTKVNKTSLDILIKIDYFSDYGDINTLLYQRDIFSKYVSKKVINKTKLTDEQLKMFKIFSNKETAKQFREIDTQGLVDYLIKHNHIKPTTKLQKIAYEVKYMGYSDKIIKEIEQKNSEYANYNKFCSVVVDIDDDKYGRHFVTLYQIKTGYTHTFRCNKSWWYEHNDIEQGDVIEPIFNELPQKVLNDKGHWVNSKTETYWELSMWTKVDM